MDINKLIEERDMLRRSGKYEEADKIRQKLLDMGYVVVDDKDRTVVKKHEPFPQTHRKAYIAIFGSGETSPTGRSIHDYILKKLNKDNIVISLISTPAGFQPNIQVVMEEVKQFFSEHLTNYHPKIKIIYANTLEDANNEEIVRQLEDTDYLFIGPGSPTYAIKHLKGSLLLRRVIELVKSGTSICIASAAAIAFSKYALPVYELYKVGEQLHWVEGLNIFRDWYKSLTIVPHFNNNEGGEKTDTSRCYMGQDRFKKLLALLPNDTAVIGIDENTSYILYDGSTEIKGIGTVHFIR